MAHAADRRAMRLTLQLTTGASRRPARGAPDVTTDHGSRRRPARGAPDVTTEHGPGRRPALGRERRSGGQHRAVYSARARPLNRVRSRVFMTPQPLTVAVVGATGVVGRTMVA